MNKNLYFSPKPKASGLTPGFGAWYDPTSWFSGDEASDHDRGVRILQAYYDAASVYPAFGFSNFDAYLNSILTKIPESADLIGEVVRLNEASTTEAGAIERVQDLANKTSGKATIVQVTTAASGHGDTINWQAAIPEITTKTAQDVVQVSSQALENVGQGVLSTLNMAKYLPYILLGAGAIYIVVIAKPWKKI